MALLDDGLLVTTARDGGLAELEPLGVRVSAEATRSLSL